MDGGVEADVPMNYATIQIYPAQNRYEAFVHSNKRKEEIATGLLENLLPHLPQVKNLCVKGPDACLDLQLPEELHGAEWFTKSSFQRFMHIVNSTDLIKSTSGIMQEIFQLDESKRFHLSLYVQEHQEHVQSGKKGDTISIDLGLKSKPEVKMVSSDASKNELLRAMDLRIRTLSNELLTIFKKAAGALHSYKDISYLVEFARQFEAADLEHYLERFLELIQKSHIDIPASERYSRTCDSKNDDVDSAAKNGQISKAFTPIKYGASPAKVAEIERQSSTESEESSYSSDEGKASAERSRTLIRSATPRRSASPMKRIQIGRTGPRRAAAITIKSLNHFPSRERPLLHREIAGNGLEGEVSEQHKKTEIDVRRITVQDAISLFERKQRDHTADNETKRSLKDASLISNKSILRRWSAGMGEGPAECQLENPSEDSNSVVSINVAVSEVSQISELKTAPDQAPECRNDYKTNESFVVPQKQESEVYSAESPMESNLIQENEVSKTKASLIEWNRQKEVELNRMLMKMMESKPVNKSGKLQPRKSQNLPREHRGGSYDSYKEKRNAKLPREIAGKRADEEVQCQGMQKMLNKKNAEMATKNASVDKTNAATKPQKSVDFRKEASKSSSMRKVPSKPSSMHTVRKSWSATPLPRETSILPAKARGGTSSAGSTPMRQKPQPKMKDPEISLKKEKPRAQQRNGETQSDRVRSLKSLNDKQKPSIVSKSRISREKAATPEGERPVPSKRSLPNKGTKKSSIVPLESKPSIGKVSGISNGASPVNKIKGSPKMGKSPASLNKIKDSPKLDKSLNNFENHVGGKQKESVVAASDEINRHIVVDIVKLDHRDTAVEAESGAKSNKQCIELESLENVNSEDVDMLKITEDSLSKSQAEESTISPSAWVEIEECVGVRSPCRGGASQSLSPAYIAPVGVVSPRVRHSLSQMLHEESNEHDFCEWGNAENPPVIICQKDAPKGFKRLLKFARKSKGEANSSGRSSPSIFSEGEDDAEESKASSKRNAAFHTRDYGHYNSSLHEGSRQSIVQSNLSKYEGQHYHKMQETYDGVAGSTNKAFRGNKPSETRLR